MAKPNWFLLKAALVLPLVMLGSRKTRDWLVSLFADSKDPFRPKGRRPE